MKTKISQTVKITDVKYFFQIYYRIVRLLEFTHNLLKKIKRIYHLFSIWWLYQTVLFILISLINYAEKNSVWISFLIMVRIPKIIKILFLFYF